jgi:uncharacterized protein involved in type VI secretion and phage assembly
MADKAMYGVYRAVVTETDDPESRARVKVRFPWLDATEAWAELATLMAGAWFRPDADDEVLVAFEGGDVRRPYVVGALWGERERPPEQDVKTIRTRCGATITIDDARCEVRVEAPTAIQLVASRVAVDAASADFSGIVRCETLIANSVVASSYTPGAGNVM